jgi:NADH:ubiquinone oxidoreductase subunit 6 (subunit J)
LLVTVAFVLLGLLSLAALLALLVSRHLAGAVAAFGLYTAALVSMYVLLNLRVAAALQLVVNASLAAAIWLGTPDMETVETPQSSSAWYALAATPLTAVACWSVAQGSLGEPTLDAMPVWAAGAGYLQAVGEQLLSAYLIPLLLVALLLLVAVVAISYVRAGRTEGGRGGK